MSIHVGFSGEYLASRCSREELEAEAGVIMDALLELEASGCGLSDAAVAVDLGAFMVTIEVEAEAGSFEEAQAIVDSCIRSAIHKAGGRTPGWELLTRQAHTELVDA